jgi:tetratricopeptide (TPR) repeat protein
MFPGSPVRRVLFVVVATLLTLPVALRGAQPQQTPPLPRLALDTYPAAAREALARASQQASAAPTDADAVGRLARTLHAWEQWDAAHQAYARAQALAPRTFDWHYLDALVLQRLARHPDAVKQLEQALTVNPSYLPARLRHAESLLDAGNLEESRKTFEALIREPGAEPAAQFGLGRIDAAQGRHDQAIPRFERAIALYPEFGAAYYALALSSRAAGRPDAARNALAAHGKYGARWPAIEDPVRAAVTTLRDDAAANLQRGVQLAGADDVAGAIAAHEAALSRDPSLVQAHANLITLYGRQRNWTKAEEHYNALQSLGANLADAHYDYGVLLGLQEKWDQSADAYKRALAIEPSHVQAHNNLGQLLERRQEFEAAANEYRQAVNIQPTFRLARFNLGRMLLALGRTDDAIAELEKLTQPRDSEAPRYIFAFAAAHIRAGHREEGIKWAEEARRLALEYGQQDLAASIERDLARIK